MEEIDVETIVQRAREKYPDENPRIISDNGPQFISKEFKQFIRISGMTHVRTSPYYPQTNGKLERYHRTIKSDCIRPGTPLTLEDARRIITRFVDHYNNVRLHSAIQYITPDDKLQGREKDIFAERDPNSMKHVNSAAEGANKLQQHAMMKMPGRRIWPCWGATRAPNRVRKRRSRRPLRRPSSYPRRFWYNAINPIK